MSRALIFLLIMFLMSAPEPATAQGQATLCRFLPIETSQPVASADYVPGVDISGKPVIPADIDGGHAWLSDIIRIPVTIDLAQGLALPLPAGTELQAGIGMLEIYRDGRVLMNGQNLTSKAYALCDVQAPYDIEAAAGDPKPQEAVQPPEPLVKDEAADPEPPKKENEIIWGEGY